MQQPSIIHSSLPPSALKGYKNFDVKEFESLEKIGVQLKEFIPTMDSLQPTITSASFTTLIQNLQAWLPGIVYILTQARKADLLIGRNTVGAWEDDQVVQQVMELTGNAQLYTGYSNVPLANYNVSFEYSTVVRFEEGIFVENLAAAKAARQGVNASNVLRQAATLMLEVSRNLIAFNGLNSGNGKTYGLLNAPGQPAYVTVASGDSGSPLWSSKTTLNIIHDLQVGIAELLKTSGANINPRTTPITVAVATAAWTYLTTVTDLGYSVLDWATKAFPNMRFEDAPELNTANGGVGVFYMYADVLDIPADNSTDDRRVFSQNVPTLFRTNGVEQKAKGLIEDYVNGTAGVMCKRPYGIVRYSGIA